MKSRFIFGVGINDAGYQVAKKVDGRDQRCPFYQTWKNMLLRCYSESYLLKKPSYRGCSVCDDWKTFSTFKSWMETQDWKGKSLDKDLIVPGNKMYCPERCIFIESWINSFLIEDQAKESDMPTGVYFDRSRGNYQAYIKDRGKRKHLGRFLSPQDAHSAWRKAKAKMALNIANNCEDQRLSAILVSRYGPAGGTK